jgi:large repetitive protein
VLAGDKVRHSYAKAGTYPVKLTVSDGTGLACGQVTQEVEVSVRSRE